jgi:hypothetical protein
MITAPQFSFVSFEHDAPYSLPVRQWGDLSFQIEENEGISFFSLETADGIIIQELYEVTGYFHPISYNSENGMSTYLCVPVFDCEIPECFRIGFYRRQWDWGINGWRTILLGRTCRFHRDTSRYTSRVTYICDGSEFGWTYRANTHLNRVRLPLYLKEPQFPQKDEIYNMWSGRKVTIWASIEREWELETDYLPASLHEKLVVALSHDSVWIDGVLLTKTGDYKIDWKDTLELGGLPCAKASCKMSENLVHRNTNTELAYDPNAAIFQIFPKTIVLPPI